MIAFIINGITWLVKCVQPNDPVLMNEYGDFTLGCCDNTRQMIYIAETLGPKMFNKVLCHEVTHAAMFSYGVLLTIDQEELLADIFATYGKEIIEVTNKVFSKLVKRDRF